MTDDNTIAETPQEEPKQSVFDKVEEELAADDTPPGEEPTEVQSDEQVEVRCPDCPWKAGFKDEYTYCQTCNGSGRVKAEPLA